MNNVRLLVALASICMALAMYLTVTGESPASRRGYIISE